MTEYQHKESGEITFPELMNSVSRLIQHLRKKILTIAVISLCGGVVGFIYASMQKPNYEATLTFSTSEEKNMGGGFAGLAAQFGVNIGTAGNVFNGDNLLALIQSKKILTRSLLQPDTINGQKTNLLNYYIATAQTNSAKEHAMVSFPLQQLPSTYSRLQDSVLNEICAGLLKGNITTSRIDKKLDLFAITCTSQNEIFSQHLSEQLIKQVSSFYIETKTKRSAQTVAILEKSADSIKRAYNEALAGRATMADANINPALQQPVVGIQRRQTDITVLATAYSEIIKNLEIAKFNLLQSTPLIQIIDEPVLPLKKIKLGKLIGSITCMFFLFVLSVVFLSFKFYVKKQPVAS